MGSASIAIGIATGLTASVAWAFANLTIQRTSRVDGPVRPVLSGQIVGASVLLLALPWFPPTGAPVPWGWLAVGGLASLLGYVGMFKAFAGGPMSIVSPIIAAWALVSAALGVLLLNEALPLGRAVGALLVILGVTGLAGGKPSPGQGWLHGKVAGVGAALVSALGFGVMVVATRPIEVALGTPLTILVLWATQWLALVPWVLLRHGPHFLPPREIRLAVVGFGLLEAIGFVAMVTGARLAPMAVVAPTASLGALITVGLGWWRLGERVGPAQVGLAITVVAGVVLLGQ